MQGDVHSAVMWVLLFAGQIQNDADIKRTVLKSKSEVSIRNLADHHMESQLLRLKMKKERALRKKKERVITMFFAPLWHKVSICGVSFSKHITQPTDTVLLCIVVHSTGVHQWGHLIRPGKGCLRDVRSEETFLETSTIYLEYLGLGGLQVKQTLLGS